MTAKMLTEAAYPSPPPPPQSSPPKNSRKLLVVAFLLIIIVVSAGVLFYLASSPSSTNPTPNPSATPTATPTSSPTGTSTPSPTATPSGNNPMAHFRAGTWANYVIKTYGTGGEVTAENTMKYAVDEGTYSGVACWLLKVEMQMNEDSDTIKTVMTYWMDKSNLQGIHVKTQMYTNGELTYEHEDDISPGDAGDMPEPLDMSTVTSYETITVPAGTFNCGKITITSTVSGTTTTTSEWANSDIPVIGLVKMETTSGGALTSTTELTAYGG